MRSINRVLVILAEIPAITERTNPVQTGPARIKGRTMVFVKAHRKQFLLAGSLAAAVTAFTVTACGGSAAAPAHGSAPGQWTQAEVSQFKTAAGSGGSSRQEL